MKRPQGQTFVGPKEKPCCGDSRETLTEGHGSLELLNRVASDKGGTQFVLSPRHATVVSYAIVGGAKKRASPLILNKSDYHDHISSRSAMEILHRP